MNEEYLTISQVMDLLQVSRTKLYEMTKDELIPSIKLGRTVRYKKTDIDKALATAQEETKTTSHD